MEKFKILTLSLLFACMLSCSNSGKVKIGYLVPNLKSERYQREVAFFKEKINALGGEALTASAEYDDKLQIEQAREMIEQGVKVLVVNSVNMNTAAAIVRDAHDNGVKVIAYDRVIRNCDLDLYISFDNQKVGKLMAEYVTRIKPDGNYILIGGDKADLNAVLVKNGQMEVLNKYVSDGRIKISYNVFVEDWSGDNAYHDLNRFLKLSDIAPDAILSSYDGMSLGCLKALDEHGLAGKVLITGQDAELEACRNIMKDRQTMTVYKPLKTLAENAAELAFKMASNQKIETPTTTIENGQKSVPAILLDPTMVDKNNMKTTIIADGFYSEAQITD